VILAFTPGLFEGATDATGLLEGVTDTTETQALKRAAAATLRVSLTNWDVCIVNRPAVSDLMRTLTRFESSPSVTLFHEKGLRIAPQP
jgi:hypothetical protein